MNEQELLAQGAALVAELTEGCLYQEERARRWKGVALIALSLCAGLALLCLSGCLTAAKIGQWQRAVHSWGMGASASKPCRVASAEASAYLANANQRLAEAGKLTDLDSDSRARELVTSAALACGKTVP